MRNGIWQLWIDTGGTFTDCIGVDPAGGGHRAKVLSSGVMRVIVGEVMDARTVRIERPRELPAGFFAGFTCIFGEESASAESDGCIVKEDDGRGLLRLSHSIAGSVVPGLVLSLQSPEEAPILAARVVTGTPANPLLPVMEMRLATTRATNALLERRGGRVAFFITRGFRDLLLIGDQTRPELFSLTARRPPPLYETVFEVHERLSADGSVLEPLDEHQLRRVAREAREQGMEIAAIALLHAHINSVHERRVEEILRESGFAHVSRSSQVAPFIKILHRAETTIANAYVAPVIEEYVARVNASLGRDGESKLRLLTSAGGLVSSEEAQPKDCLLSGPAGGVVGAARAGAASGFARIIGFDMGGTSTDVCRSGGEYDYRFEQRVGDARIMAPALAIETVAAGGGSICAWRFGRLEVGPQSAGAEPGPACYGRGGPLTITDVNLLLGRLDPDRFEIPIDVEAAERAFEKVHDEVAGDSQNRFGGHDGTNISLQRIGSGDLSEPASLRSCGQDARTTGHSPPSREELLEGFLAIADERMAEAMARVSLRRGFDPREHALVAFGGAGGQHACRVAERLGIATVLLPRDASLLSAVGLGFARVERFAEKQILRRLDALGNDFDAILRELEREALAAVARQGESAQDVAVVRRIASVRVEGQESSIEIDFGGFDEIGARFREAYRGRYGHEPSLTAEKGIEIESLRVIAASVANSARTIEHEEVQPASPAAGRARRCFIGGTWRELPVIERDGLSKGEEIIGPAIVVERSTSIVVEDGWRGEVDGAGAVVVRRVSTSTRATISSALSPGPSPGGRGEKGPRSEIIERDLFAARFTAIAEEMGEMLERTAISTNVKERRDFSCALLDRDGTLLVNAPHIPVHLGSLGICVRAVRDAIKIEHGDVMITNHPAFGGSHLPDVTLITPAFDAHGMLLGYAASRAHHAEMGGSRPGSMPPDATTLEEEGVVISPMHLVRAGVSRFDEVESVLRSARFPSRTVADNLADIRAAVAANQRGVDGLRRLAAAHGTQSLLARMGDLRDHAAALAAEAITRLQFAQCGAGESMDDGAPIAVALEREGGHLRIDFTGSAAQHPGNLNATPAIVHSAVIYVLRLLIGEMLPLNEGIMKRVSITIPRGMLNPVFSSDPARCPAVVGGNTEVSQRVVDVLIKALGLCAASQGTMNNILFGNEKMGYYETICGGGGAGPGYDGADAIQCHMTNTRITDPEILERRFPVRLNRFETRRGSGGAGRHCGGDGVIREVEFLAPLFLSVLTQRRTTRPFGMAGGENGQAGRQQVLRTDGSTVKLQPIDGCEMTVGDRLIVETPGGGGYGEKSR